MRGLIGAAAAALVVAMVPSAALALPTTPERLAGGDRYGTSAAVAASLYSSAGTVFIASGTNYPDALAGAPAAAAGDGPLLLASTTLADSVRAQVDRLNPTRIVVLGGTESVSDAVPASLAKDGRAVDRVAGTDRYETAAAIARTSFPGKASTVFIASGENYADALAGAPAAGAQSAPILLVKRDALPSSVQTELERLDPDRIVVLGGTGAVSAGVESALAATASVVRLAGDDRFGTSAAIARAYPGSSGTVTVASGETFPDALSVAAPAGDLGAPLLLVRRDSVPAATLDLYSQLNPGRVIVAGGSGTISDSVVATLADPSKPVASSDAQRALTALDGIRVSDTKATGYKRDLFGDWYTDGGCNTRHKVLARDLVNITYGSGCKVSSGTLHDPYTGQVVELQTTSSGSSIEIDHIVPLSVAWYYGANTWTDQQRRDFNNDQSELQATVSAVNQSKGNKTLSQWQPSNASYVCTYTIRYVNVVAKWNLAISPEDATWARQKLPTC